MSELVDRNLYYDVHIYPPESIQQSANVTLHLSLEKVSTDTDVLYMDGRMLDADQTTTYTNYTPPGSDVYVNLSRHVSSEDVEQVMLDVVSSR